MNQPPIIELKNVSLSFDKHIVHKNISFKLFTGEVIVLMGPSGTGKSVILKLIIGILPPTSGEIFIANQCINDFSEDQMRDSRLNLGMLFQGAALFDSISVFDNVAYPLKQLRRFNKSEIKKTVEEKLNLVGLIDTQNKFPPELSGGQKKRIGLARALATNPKVLLFDEPTTGLDPTSRGKIDKLILTLKKKYNITSIVVTHDMESARNVADRLILLSDGEVIVDGVASELWDKNMYIKKFSEGNWENEAT